VKSEINLLDEKKGTAVKKRISFKDEIPKPSGIKKMASSTNVEEVSNSNKSSIIKKSSIGKNK
jgi:hypothetical protein